MTGQPGTRGHTHLTDPTIIAISSQKGGTGKTSTSISLAAGLARKGKRTLLVDIDSQANSSKVLLPDYLRIPKEQTIYATILERKALPVHPTGIAQLSVVPSHILLSNTDVELTNAIDHREERLKRQLDPLATQYDYVIINCPPALSWLTINAFTAANQVLVVASPGYFELDSIVQISKTIQEVQDYFNPHLTLAGYLFTMSDATVNTRTSIQVLRQTYTDRVLQTVIPRNTDIRDAHFNKQNIFAFNPYDQEAEHRSHPKRVGRLGLFPGTPATGNGTGSRTGATCPGDTRTGERLNAQAGNREADHHP